VTISAKIQPIDQISIGVEYYIEPKSISGALYHKVTTSWEYGRTGMVKVLANPKSAIFNFSRINNLVTIIVQQNVRGLKISMHNSFHMTICNSGKHLIQYPFYFHRL
jgi:hypothetical protein